MIGNSKIYKAIEQGDIAVCYSFLPDKEGKFERVDNNIVAASKGNHEAFEFLKSKIVRNRICLTVGPVILPINNGTVPSKANFRGIPGVVDLRKCKNGYSIPAGQSVVLYTNEAIALSKDYSAIILSRVAYYSSGIMVQASYVDSKWRGIVKLCLTNLSNSKFKISLGDDVARMLIFETVDADESISKLTETTYHYNTGWGVILDGPPIDPFHRIQTQKTSYFLRFSRFFKRNFDKLIGIGFLAFIVTAIPASWPIAKEIAQFMDLKERFVILEKKTTSLEGKLSEANNKLPVHGYSELTLNSQGSLTDKVYLPESINHIPSFTHVELLPPAVNRGISVKFHNQNGKLIMYVSCPSDAISKKQKNAGYKWFVIP